MTKFHAFIAALLLCAATTSHAATACFDDRYPGQTSNTSYPGMTVTGSNAGIWGGVGNGDPGNWGLGGTCGSAFLGVNSGVSTTFNFTPSRSSFSIDIGVRTGFTGTYTVTAFNGGNQVGQNVLTVTGTASPTGTWATSTFTGLGAITSVTVVRTAGAAPYWGYDNINYELAAVAAPTPAAVPTLNEWSVIILSLLLALVAVVKTRRRG